MAILGLEAMRMPLAQGSPAIPFQLPSTTGEVLLSRLRGAPFLLSFFSMAFTPV